MSDIDVMQNAKGETNSPPQAEFDPMRWAQLNPWLSEGQADDRTPMNGSVKNSGGITIRSALLRPEDSSGDVQEVVANEAGLSQTFEWTQMINLYINQRRVGDVSILDLKGRERIRGVTLALHESICCLAREGKIQVLLTLPGSSTLIRTGWASLFQVT